MSVMGPARRGARFGGVRTTLCDFGPDRARRPALRTLRRHPMSTLSNKRDEIRSAIQSSRAPAVVRAVVDRRLTYLTWPRLHSLQRACAEIAEVPGDVVE